MTLHMQLRTKKEINWRELCFEQKIFIKEERIVPQREILPNEYRVERLISRKLEKRKELMYMVKWEGYSVYECSWEPEAHLNQVLLNTFYTPEIDDSRLALSARNFELAIQQRLRGKHNTVIIRFDLGYLESLVKSIRSCGVSFNIWTPKSGRCERDWTSFRGDDMKKIMKNLPEKLMFCIHNNTHDQTVKLWNDFSSILRLINSPAVELKTPEFVFNMCKKWASDFIEIGKERNGYRPENITPYIHTLVYHIPFYVIRKFSGQAVEKVNDSIKTIYQKKTNKMDCTIDTIKVRKRIENLCSEMERERRNYVKKNDDWWEHHICVTRAQKKENVSKEIQAADEKFHIPTVNPSTHLYQPTRLLILKTCQSKKLNRNC